jgi:hypothetical protein
LLPFRKESDLGRVPFDAPALFYDRNVPIDLDLVQSFLPVLAVALLEQGGVVHLPVLDVVAEISIEPGALFLEEHKSFIQVFWVETRALEPFKAENGLFNTSVHHENCFIDMGFLHLNLLYFLRLNRPNPGS